MSYLLDTNVLSELAKAQPQPQAMAFFQGHALADFFISALSLAELKFGISALPPGKKKQDLERWYKLQLPPRFEGRVLAVDRPVAEKWADLKAGAQRSLPIIDALIAATALAHGLTLVTRNEKDFRFPELTIINPWK